MNDEQQIFLQLGIALAIGLLIGIERGWKQRDTEEGGRVAGVRTYGLIGFLGGVCALLAGPTGDLLMGLAFVGMAGVLTAVYVINLQVDDSEVGITSLIAGLLAFVFGALAVAGEEAVAAASAVITILLLGAKPVVHRWVSVLKGNELRAGVKLLLISVVLLPLLPNQGYGPWQALNPYAIWWMVVLIAAISFFGYFAVKIGGEKRGTVFTGLFGGLASSTALALHFSRMAKTQPEMAPILATGILLACGMMIPRMIVLVGVLNRQLLEPILVPSMVMAALVYLPALGFLWVQKHHEGGSESPLKNPLDLQTALGFGALLALVMLLGRALKTWFGDAGVYGLAAVSGVSDVNAITLSLARMAQEDLAIRTAVLGIVIAGAVNNLAKGVMAVAIGGRPLLLRVALPLLLSGAGGLLTAWFWIPAEE